MESRCSKLLKANPFFFHFVKGKCDRNINIWIFIFYSKRRDCCVTNLIYSMKMFKLKMKFVFVFRFFAFKLIFFVKNVPLVLRIVENVCLNFNLLWSFYFSSFSNVCIGSPQVLIVFFLNVEMFQECKLL